MKSFSVEVNVYHLYLKVYFSNHRQMKKRQQHVPTLKSRLRDFLQIHYILQLSKLSYLIPHTTDAPLKLKRIKNKKL